MMLNDLSRIKNTKRKKTLILCYKIMATIDFTTSAIYGYWDSNAGERMGM